MNDSIFQSLSKFSVGHWSIDSTTTLLSALLLIAVAALLFIIKNNRQRALAESQAAERSRQVDRHMQNLFKTHAEMQGRMQTMTDIFGKRQSELNQSIRDQINGMTHNIGQNINAQTKSTHENLSKLQERLAVIDSAQNNIQSLAGQVVQLQAILANKQTRGAFGQGRMEAIIADALPQNAYSFQATLSNRTRPDCLVFMPNNAPSLAIDAKFPLEAWNKMREASSAEKQKNAQTQFLNDMNVHIRTIAQKYLIAGETQDTAFLFVPSESIFATIHEKFETVVQKAHHARVIIVSPSLLMLSISVIQSILKDARMREQAHLIQSEVTQLMKDVGLLDERVRKLQNHFQQAGKDIDNILISSSKVVKRGQRIEAMELNSETDNDVENVQDQQQKPSLRLVEEE